MNDLRRELFFKVIDGDPRLVDIMFQFDRFKHCERMLQWLVVNKITGPKFFDIYLNQFKASWLTMGKWIVMKINKDSELKPLIGGRDFHLLK
jgi:hypothetical protein